MKRLLLLALALFFAPSLANAQETKETKKTKETQETKSQTRFNISTTKVIEKEFSQSRRYYAILEPNEALIFSQTLRFDGYVEKLYANKTYTPIKKGDRLLSVYSPELASVQSELLSSLKFNQQVGAIKEN